MKFPELDKSVFSEYPKREVIIQSQKQNMARTNDKCIVHFRDYKPYLDKVVYYTLEGSWYAWKDMNLYTDFIYDQARDIFRAKYKDEFGRELKVTKHEYDILETPKK